MKELKILAIVVAITAITYIGIEPIAHIVMHPHVSEADFEYKDLAALEGKGDVTNGMTTISNNCVSCHTVETLNIGNAMLMGNVEGGVIPPDLSLVGRIYSERFLSAFLMNPNHAAFESTHKIAKEHALEEELKAESNTSKHAHLKEASEKAVESFNAKAKMAMYPITSDKQEVLDIIAALKDISSKTAMISKADAAVLAKMDDAIDDAKTKGKDVAVLEEEKVAKTLLMQNRFVYETACGRCHTMEYDKAIQPTLEGVAKAEHDLAKAQRKDNLTKYLGSTPPDLSQMIHARGEEYLLNFISDPQKYLTGTAMPRVGVTQEAATQIVAYIEKIDDAKKEERNSLGLWVMGFMVIFSILAYLFKREIWHDLH